MLSYTLSSSCVYKRKYYYVYIDDDDKKDLLFCAHCSLMLQCVEICKLTIEKQ